MKRLSYLTPNLPKTTPRISLNDGSILIYKHQPKTDSTIQSDLNPSLPPLLRKTFPPREKLTNTLIQELRDLRNNNPDIWTVSALSKRFNVAPDTIKRFAPCPKERKELLVKESEKEFDDMSLNRKKKIINRIRRKEFW